MIKDEKEFRLELVRRIYDFEGAVGKMGIIEGRMAPYEDIYSNEKYAGALRKVDARRLELETFVMDFYAEALERGDQFVMDLYEKALEREGKGDGQA